MDDVAPALFRPAPDLTFHGDSELAPGLIDCAVNVRAPAPPGWLRDRLAAELDRLGGYPDLRLARTAAAARHRRPVEELLLTAGGAEAFTLLARVLQPRRAVIVHPSFTEPELALRAAGRPVERLVLPPPFRLDAARVPAEADLVVLGNPTNPTSVLHPAGAVGPLARAGRTLVVDEAFADAVPGEPASLAGRRDLPGLVVVRSLTKTWALAGLRVGYLIASAALVRRLGAAQPSWPVSSLAAAAVQGCCSPEALRAADDEARTLATERTRYAELLAAAGAEVVPGARAPFLLVHVPDGPQVRAKLRVAGFAVRRGDTFPGLGPDWLRIAVRDPDTDDRLAAALARILASRQQTAG